MNRRGSQRIRRRIPCAFEYEGHAYNGIVVDLSADGLFLQTDTAIEPGSELSLELRSSPEVSVRGQVVRRRFTPAVLSSLIRRGVGLRLVHAPPAYYEVLGLEAAAPQPVWSAVEERESEPADADTLGPIAIDIRLDAEPAPEAAPAAPAHEPWDEPETGGWSLGTEPPGVD